MFWRLRVSEGQGETCPDRTWNSAHVSHRVKNRVLHALPLLISTSLPAALLPHVSTRGIVTADRTKRAPVSRNTRGWLRHAA